MIRINKNTWAVGWFCCCFLWVHMLNQDLTGQLSSFLSLLPKQLELLVSDTLPSAECLTLDIKKKTEDKPLRPQLPALRSVSRLARSSLHWPSQTQTLVLSPRSVYLVMQGS